MDKRERHKRDRAYERYKAQRHPHDADPEFVVNRGILAEKKREKLKKHEKSHRKRQRHDRFDWTGLIVNGATVFLTGAAAVAAIVLAYFTGQSINDARNSASVIHNDTMAAINRADTANGISQDTANRQLRAYVGLVIPDDVAQNNFLPPNKPAIHLDVKNTGQTPAYDVTFSGNVMLDKYPLPKGFIFRQLAQDSAPAPNTIFPGKLDALGIFHTFKDVLNSKQISQIESRNWRVYLYGTIKYIDAFKHRHWTNYCLAIHITSIIGTNVTVAHDICSAHNDTDDG